MVKSVGRFLRRIADRLDKPREFTYTGPDPQVWAIEKQTDAIKALTRTVERKDAIVDAAGRVAWRMVGPELARSIEGTRSAGTSDTEILDTLVFRIREGWYE